MCETPESTDRYGETSCDSLSEVEQRHGDPAQSLDAAALLPLLVGSGRRQTAGVQRHRQLRLSGQLVDLHRETNPAHTHTHTHATIKVQCQTAAGANPPAAAVKL